MREIKFRGKVIEKGMKHFWEYGGIIHITERYKDEEDFEECNIYQLINESGVGFDVVKETIGQYVGLKDKNGVEIYEGDYLERKFDITTSGVVEFRRGVFGVRGKDGKFREINLLTDEVIGNIYDNPELIEKEGK